MGRQCCTAAIARATRRAKRSSPKSRISSASSALGQGRNQIRGARTLAAHSHIERPVKAKRKTALGGIELRRGDAEIKSDAGDRLDGHRGEQANHLAEAPLDDRQSSAKMLGQIAPAPHRIGVAVNPEDAAACRGEQRHAVAASAEGCVDVDGIVARRQRGEHGVQQDGNVRMSVSGASDGSRRDRSGCRPVIGGAGRQGCRAAAFSSLADGRVRARLPRAPQTDWAPKSGSSGRARQRPRSR